MRADNVDADDDVVASQGMKSSEHSDPSESTMLAISWPGREVAMTTLRHSAMNGAS
jgi:hypothetical protein